MKKIIIKKPYFLFIAMTLVGCQSNPNKPPHEEPTYDEVLDIETMAMGWTQLQQNTLNNLREKNFGQAHVNIKQMMTFAGKDSEKWEYIRMALVSMPSDLALELIDQALDKPFIKQSLAEQFAFTRVLTQLKAEDKALEVLNQVIKEDKTPEFVYWRARLYLLMEQEDLAEKDYKWLLKQEPKNTDYLSQYVTLLNFLGRNDEAMSLLQDNEEDVDLLFRQIILLIQKDQENLAVKKLGHLKVLAKDVELTADQKLEIGELAFWLKDYDYSMALLQEVKSGEHINKAKLLMANVLVEQGQYDRASVMYHQVQNGPEEHAITAYQLEIELYRKQGDMQAAMATANSGLRMFKNDTDLLYSRAMLHGALDDIHALEKDLQKILQSDPQNPDAMNALGYTWADNDINLDQAYDYIKQAHEQKPNDKAILDSVGWIYYKKGDLDKAEKYLRLAIENNTRDAESYHHLIEVLEKQGNNSEAGKLKARVKELFPEM